jgi:hypothetical protein
MTIKTLFNIILKILGIFFIKDTLTFLGTMITYYNFIPKSTSYHSDSNTSLIVSVAVGLTYILAFYMLIFQSNFIIKMLRLDKGFDEDTISLNIHRSTILSIGIIVIGGLMIAYGIPDFCRQLYSYSLRKDTFRLTNADITYTVIDATKIFIGLLLIGFQRPIVNLIEWKRRKTIDDHEEETE